MYTHGTVITSIPVKVSDGIIQVVVVEEPIDTPKGSPYGLYLGALAYGLPMVIGIIQYIL